MPELISKEDARLCASIVEEVAHAQGFVREPAAIGRLTVSVAKLYHKGLRDRDQLLAAAMLLPK
ncbi:MULTISPECIES: hypothetical protein [Agrobacterium]|jgi:hypothetical protein|uniref:Uncharacterized protein n=1 Tax=Agrobacterium tumefaciens TaxID=358 RepID=A0A2L2LLT3_AGRTU|nr:hypothetical protein [Agrobacterium tumefaciens]AVH45293.1 hypothetical protein At1D1609_52600 [Agrobacterium tumefaciens]NSY99030.1 hypothetical protein [Agrobacterium tumefaciens]QCL98049.1 hypothetical protein CFBP7129_28010 [Agrobacterium tumefaciens]